MSGEGREKGGGGVSYDCGQRFFVRYFQRGAVLFFSFSFSLHKSIGLDSIIGHLVYQTLVDLPDRKIETKRLAWSSR